VVEKFDANAAQALDPKSVEQLREAVLGLESIASLAPLQLLARAARRR